jgi:L-ascorbate metabolism protein UlaG (beta-lactamase superfamily)
MWGEVVRAAIPAGKAMLWGLGGPSVALRAAQTTIVIDPYLGGDAREGWERAIPLPFEPEAFHNVDAVMSSHHHTDHCHEPTLRAILDRTDAHLYGARSSAAKWRAWNFPEARYRALAPGDTISVGGVGIRAHAALDWEDPTALAFTFRVGEYTIYHGGDTLYFEGLAACAPVNWALLSYARNLPQHPAKLYMDDEDVHKAVKALQAVHTLIMHWDLWRAPYIDPAPLVASLRQAGYQAEAMHMGDCILIG